AERDVLQPYAAPRQLLFRKSFARRGKRVWTLALSTPLDGSLELDVTLPRGGFYGAMLLDSDRKTPLANGLWSSATTKRITATVCGERTLYVRVTQKGAFGRVAVSETVP